MPGNVYALLYAVLMLVRNIAIAAGVLAVLTVLVRLLAKKLGIKPMTLVCRTLVLVAAVATFTALIFLIVYILVHGVPYLKPSLFALEYNSDNVSMLPSVINTLMMTVLALLIAVPLGVFTASYLVEYAGRGNKLVEVVRLTSETLSGIPSIVYGLFGMLFFVTALGWGMSLLAGALTVSIMILPLIIRTTEEALLAVPDMYREASYGLGAGRLRTVFRVVLPSAVPGIQPAVLWAKPRP